MNTKIEYLYRDADNYKVWSVCVISGELTKEQRQTIHDCLDMGEFFIPGAVGLPENRFPDITEADHCWFEMCADPFEDTMAEPNVEITADELVAAFLRCKDNWPESEFAVCEEA